MSNQKYSIKSISSFQAIVLNAVLLSLCALVSCNQPKPVTSTDAESSELSRTTTEKSPLLGDLADSMFLADRINDRVTQANVSQHPVDTITLTRIPMEQLDSIPFMPLMDGDDLVFYSKRNGKVQKHVRPNSILISTSENGQYALISKKTEWPSEYDSVRVIDRHNNLLAEDRMPKLGFESTWQTIIVWDNGKYLLSSTYGETGPPVLVDLYEIENFKLKKVWNRSIENTPFGHAIVSNDHDEIFLFDCVTNERSSTREVWVTKFKQQRQEVWKEHFKEFDYIRTASTTPKGQLAIIAQNYESRSKQLLILDNNGTERFRKDVGLVGNYKCNVSPDGKLLIVISGAHYFSVIDLNTYKKISDNTALRNMPVSDVLTSGDSTFVLGVRGIDYLSECRPGMIWSLVTIHNNNIVRETSFSVVDGMLRFQDDPKLFNSISKDNKTMFYGIE